LFWKEELGKLGKLAYMYFLALPSVMMYANQRRQHGLWLGASDTYQ